jgi:hypothetical protein
MRLGFPCIVSQRIVSKQSKSDRHLHITRDRINWHSHSSIAVSYIFKLDRISIEEDKERSYVKKSYKLEKILFKFHFAR